MKNKNFISLKKAAKTSGYTPDYIGQLIRKGKLKGKQVYHNVAWLVSEEDLHRYINRDKKYEKKSFWTRIVSNFNPKRSFKVFSYFFIGLLLIVAILLFYIFAVSLDHKLEERALEKVQNQNNDNGIGITQ